MVGFRRAVGEVTISLVTTKRAFRPVAAFGLFLTLTAPAFAQAVDKPFEPQIGQAGKDVVWVPTPDVLVEKMLDLAKVTKDDLVMDLGSGDGRNVIAAAKRGARAIGVEYNPKMVEIARQNALKAGVVDKATFIEGDMYQADISKASVLALFLLSSNLEQLTPNFLSMKPGSRIVDNTFTIPGWTPDATETVTADCTTWCTALLWIVPAKVAGAWTSADGELVLDQQFQMVKGTFTRNGTSAPLENGRLRGDQLVFVAGSVEYSGRVNGDTLELTGRAGDTLRRFTATRAQPR